ncbi:hypothetical protein HDE_13973 [Halotydeus destructor]|nr:hypothetical protein HDE_13973 [Halotydeus destructor]
MLKDYIFNTTEQLPYAEKFIVTTSDPERTNLTVNPVLTATVERLNDSFILQQMKEGTNSTVSLIDRDFEIMKHNLHELRVEKYRKALPKRPRKLVTVKQENLLSAVLRNKNVGQVFSADGKSNFTNQLEEKRSLFGLVGISLSDHATAEHYTAAWSQVIKIENPFTSSYIKEGLSTMTETCYAPEPDLNDKDEVEVINELKKQCSTTLTNSKMSTWSLMENALESVDRDIGKPNRNKRAIFTILAITAVLALSAAGSTYAAIAAQQNAAKLNDLASLGNIKDGESVAIRDQLIGLTAINEEKMLNISKHFAVVQGHQYQFRAQVDRANKLLHHILKKQTMSSALFLNLFSGINNQVTGLGAYQSVLSQANRWMDGHIGLRHNRLPVEMVSRDNLKQILEFVASELPTDLVLALDDLDSYYSMPLVNHITVKDDVYLKLSIPLRRIDKARHLMLFHAEAVAYPCGQACNNIEEWGPDTLIRVNMKPQLWAYDVDTDEFYQTTNYLWTCTATNQGKHCFSFRREALSLGDECFKSIQGMSMDEIGDRCEFITASMDDAKPIPIGNRRYLVTPLLQGFTSKQCEKRYRLALPSFTEYGRIVVGPECRLIYRGEVILYEDLYSNTTVELALETPTTRTTLHDLRNFTFRLMTVEKLTFDKPINNLTNIKELTFDNRKLTAIVHDLRRTRSAISQRLVNQIHESRGSVMSKINGNLPEGKSIPILMSGSDDIDEEKVGEGELTRTILVFPEKPSDFSGEDGEDYKEWLQDYDIISETNGWTLNEKLSKISLYLKGNARKVYRGLYGKGTPLSWETFKDELDKTYGDSDNVSKLRKMIKRE